MIEVENLTKTYVGRTAVDGLTFSVKPGEVVGFLGPNGAGKSTTMRILAGFLPATSGTAKVNGFDVFHQSVKARQSLGYMPENAPLYLDMRVKEYLQFRGQLKGLHGKDLRKRMGEVMEACVLTEVRRKIIGTLSKGFRQRVALADAIISRPPVLILDEPTNGLDPNQIRHIRDLLHAYRAQQTILLSTHILSEVELTCDRVLLLHKGKLRADDTPKNLVRRLRVARDVQVEIQAEGTPEETFASVTGIRKITEERVDGSWRRFTLRVEARGDIREALSDLALKKQWPIRELHLEQPRLEDVFVEMTSGD
ncbi:ABC-2 type transport system ATP-binding protein [Roseimicrobium gellanilyticum]|uniref:ABC-2 type transport system ATP-binding protein n=1 Tax=Roseimicrobium gellanilyticum TaxID=748857 RepID=A0A366HVS3_9BACT|nr:ATP-binding cassette domain-containing protein [Roseimicrobium gellanilyticum]RBP47799.1 ABC-2 type transport system ATP-binding protein [Roseimicrobium gellanilyticum]